MNIFKFSVGSEAKRVAVRCVFAIGVVCWANFLYVIYNIIYQQKKIYIYRQYKLSTLCPNTFGTKVSSIIFLESLGFWHLKLRLMSPTKSVAGCLV